MDESAHSNKPPVEPPTTEVDQLLKLLDLQAAAWRGRRAPAHSPFQSPSFRYGSLIAITIFAFASLAVMEWLLSQMPKPMHAVSTPPSAIAAPGTPLAIRQGNPGSKN
jgi:hypothetical protein